MTWCPFQVCEATFAHAGHIWSLGDQLRCCPGMWTQPSEQESDA